jgi:hypothetical protein
VVRPICTSVNLAQEMEIKSWAAATDIVFLIKVPTEAFEPMLSISQKDFTDWCDRDEIIDYTANHITRWLFAPWSGRCASNITRAVPSVSSDSLDSLPLKSAPLWRDEILGGSTQSRRSSLGLTRCQHSNSINDENVLLPVINWSERPPLQSAPISPRYPSDAPRQTLPPAIWIAKVDSAQLQITSCCVSPLKSSVRILQPFLTGWQPNRSQAICPCPLEEGAARATGAGAAGRLVVWRFGSGV